MTDGVRRVRPWAVDVSSGVELTGPDGKRTIKTRAIVRSVSINSSVPIEWAKSVMSRARVRVSARIVASSASRSL